MNLDFTTFSTGALAVVPVIIALVQVFKLTGWVKDNYAPLLSIGLGMGVGWLADHNSADLTNTLLNGVIYGLSASGLYSGIKTTTEAIKVQKREQKE
jgi:hypothetical protein